MTGTAQVKDKDGFTPLHLAANAGYHKLVLALSKDFNLKLDEKIKQAMVNVREKK